MLIAGSYTPFMLISLHHHTAARVLLTAEWIAAVLGSAFAGECDPELWWWWWLFAHLSASHL